MNNSPAVSHAPAVAFFCVSVNPAIDTRLILDTFIPGKINRVQEVHRAPGGKAAHVAMALRALGANPTWIGFSGGATGSELLHGLQLLQIKTLSIPAAQSSRVNLEILDTRGEVTELLEPGGTITQPEWAHFQQVCAGAFQSPARKIAALSGSLPPGVPPDAYAALIRSAQSANCLAFLDSSGSPLIEALPARPDLVKSNSDEAESVTQIAVRDPASAAQAARKLLDLGARSAVVSLGSRGLVGVSQRGASAMHAWTAPLRPKSTVGCGDSALAGLAFANASGLSFEQGLALAVACGAANCLAPLPARLAREDVSRFEQAVHIEPL